MNHSILAAGLEPALAAAVRRLPHTTPRAVAEDKPKSAHLVAVFYYFDAETQAALHHATVHVDTAAESAELPPVVTLDDAIGWKVGRALKVFLNELRGKGLV